MLVLVQRISEGTGQGQFLPFVATQVSDRYLHRLALDRNGHGRRITAPRSAILDRVQEGLVADEPMSGRVENAISLVHHRATFGSLSDRDDRQGLVDIRIDRVVGEHVQRNGDVTNRDKERVVIGGRWIVDRSNGHGHFGRVLQVGSEIEHRIGKDFGPKKISLRLVGDRLLIRCDPDSTTDRSAANRCQPPIDQLIIGENVEVRSAAVLGDGELIVIRGSPLDSRQANAPDPDGAAGIPIVVD